jgi:hypothetical protein
MAASDWCPIDNASSNLLDIKRIWSREAHLLRGTGAASVERSCRHVQAFQGNQWTNKFRCLINALTGHMGTRSHLSGYPTNQDLATQFCVDFAV